MEKRKKRGMMKSRGKRGTERRRRGTHRRGGEKRRRKREREVSQTEHART